MSDISDIVDRAEAALEGVTEGEWVQVGLGNIHRLPVGEYPPVAKTWRQSDGDFIAEARSLIPALLAEVERLHSWQGLMSLLDEHYPETIFHHRGQGGSGQWSPHHFVVAQCGQVRKRVSSSTTVKRIL